MSWDELSNRGASAIVDRRARLNTMIPVELNVLITPGGSLGSYKLNLAVGQILLIQLDPGEWLASRIDRLADGLVHSNSLRIFFSKPPTRCLAR